ncbi:polymer-forming cytoskeletal protein [Candidatus Methanoperedens nitratireducens]|uniref:polymer-forming cytoskeletal protein n=1 Tax=Candidatus Methanoperedens nitratireducens TaxID=1392998 RepID=UPI0015CA80F6|nr:polymer-forming cytoskeletal protein [Candidatus Methanoperedens nitroreducens]
MDGDVLVGNYAELGYGIIAKTVVAGEHVKITGSILSENDIRIDLWSEITGDVRTKTDAYLGEFVNISGKLFAAGNLDVGNNVKINGGYEVKGWLVVRNPLPVVMFIFFYMMALLRLGNEEEVEKALEEMFADDAPSEKLMSIPNRTKISLEAIKTTSRAVIGSHCRLLGNVRARSASVGNHVTVFGSIRTTGSITTGAACTIHGNLDSRETVKIGRNCRVLGKVTANSIVVHETAKVDGNLISANGVTVEKDDLEGLNDTEKKLFYGFTMLEIT